MSRHWDREEKVDYNVQETVSGLPVRRLHVPFRMSAAGLVEIDRLAVLETDGVRSRMIRKLLGEALAKRARYGP